MTSERVFMEWMADFGTLMEWATFAAEEVRPSVLNLPCSIDRRTKTIYACIYKQIHIHMYNIHI